MLADKPGYTPKDTRHQGFVLSDGRYVSRVQAAEIALKVGQLKRLNAPPNLFSEDLW